jgi:DNA-binding CsgD family transcriptional regulator
MITKQKEINKYNEEIIKQTGEGLHCSLIAKKLGIGDCALRYYLNRNKIPVSSFTRKTYSEKEALEAKVMYEAGITYLDIAEHFGVGYRTVYLMLKSVGTNVTTKHTVDTEKVVELYKQNKSCKAIAEIMSCGESVIRKHLTSAGIRMRSKSEASVYRNNHTVDLDAFSDFTREHDSYFYGYLLADGCLSNNTVSISLNTKDKIILDELQNYLGMNYGRSDREVPDKRTGVVYKRSTLSFGHPLIVSRLKDQGFLPRKSTKETLPLFDWINNRHFWRGMVDGDGHIRLAKKASALVLVGSKEIVNGFILFCKETVGLITGRKASYSGEGESILYKVQLTGQDARNVARYLYKDSLVALERKKEVALSIITNKESYGNNNSTRN